MNNSVVYFNYNKGHIQDPRFENSNLDLNLDSNKNLMDVYPNSDIITTNSKNEENFNFIENYQKNLNQNFQNESINNCKPGTFANQIDKIIQQSLVELNSLQYCK